MTVLAESSAHRQFRALIGRSAPFFHARLVGTEKRDAPQSVVVPVVLAVVSGIKV